MYQNIIEDFGEKSYIISLYISAGLSMSDLKNITMLEANEAVYANEINAYASFCYQKANYQPIKKT